MTAPARIGRALMIFWMVNGAIQMFLWPHFDMDRAYLHIAAGAVQVAVAKTIYDKLNRPRAN